MTDINSNITNSELIKSEGDNMIEMTAAERMVANYEKHKDDHSQMELLHANLAIVKDLPDADAFEVAKVIINGPRRLGGRPIDGSNDLWDKVINEFRQRAASDNAKLSKLDVQGRGILYQQIARGYEIGCLLTAGTDYGAHDKIVYPELDRLLYNHGLLIEQDKLSKGTAANIWFYVTKLLYGSWIDTRQMDQATRNKLEKKLFHEPRPKSQKLARKVTSFVDNRDAKHAAPTIFHAWQHDRSAEKYANVFRYLATHNITPADAPAFIEGFSCDLGTKLLGIERQDRKDNQEAKGETTPKPISGNKQKLLNDWLARGENPDNGDVIRCERIQQLPDAVEFGRAVFKIVDGKMLFIYQGIEQAAYEKDVMAIGKKLIDDENAAAKAEQDRIKSENKALEHTRSDQELIANNLRWDNRVAKALAAGHTMDDILRKVFNTVEGLTLTEDAIA